MSTGWLPLALVCVLGTPLVASAQVVDPQDLSIYSTAQGGGALATDYVFAPNEVFLSTCLGGFCLYSSTDPGFITRSDPPSGGLFALADGTSVTMEIIAIADEASVLVGSKLLDAPGETAPLGAAPGLHLHPTWQVTLPVASTGAQSFPVTFRLTSGAPYGASASHTLILSLPGPQATATPNATATPIVTPSPTAKPSPTATASTPTPTPSPTSKPAPTPTVSLVATPKPTATGATPAPSAQPTPSPSPSAGPAPTASGAPAPSPAPTGSARPTITPTPAATGKPTATPSATPRATATAGATPTPRPGTTPVATTPLPGVVRVAPAARGDQVLFYYDARSGFTSFLSLANTGDLERDVRIDFYASDLTRSRTLDATLPARTTQTIDVGALRDQGLLAEPGIAIASAVDPSGAPIVTHALAGNFTVANLSVGSAWGGPGVTRSARTAADSTIPQSGTLIDGSNVVLEQLRPAAVELAIYHDPASLDAAADGGNQLIFVSFDDVAGRAPEVAGAAMRWVAVVSRADGTPVDAPAFDTSGVEVSHLAAVVGPDVNGAAGRLELVARTPSASNRLVFFAQSLGTFATGYLLPPSQ